MTITTQHRKLLRHTLGLDQSATSYRNRFVAGEGHSDMPLIRELVDGGYMAERKLPDWCSEGDRLFMATDAGKQEAIA